MAGQPRKRQKRAVYDSEDDDDEYIEETLPPRNNRSETPFSSAPRGSQTQSQASVLRPLSGRTSRSSQKTLSQLTSSRQPTLLSTSASISTGASPASSPKKTKSKPASSPRKGSKKAASESPSKSLRNFFRPATEEERWDRVKKEKTTQPGKENKRLNKPKNKGLFKRKAEEVEVDNEVIEDIIEDDDSDDVEILSQQLRSASSSQRTTTNYHGHLALDRRKDSDPIENFGNDVGVKKSIPNKSIKRFLLPHDQKDDVESTVTARHSSTPPLKRSTAPVVTRPWSDEFAPASLEELAVHKRKVTDIEKWLTDVFSGRSRRRLLVLRGPAGSGKTTTISLLSKALQYDIVEWKNSTGIQQPTYGYVSNSMQFDDFLGRGDKFNTLQLDSETDKPSTDDIGQSSESTRRIMLIEEFPSTLGSNSHALIAFRASLQRYLASAMPPRPLFSSNLAPTPGSQSSPPIVIIVSENMLGTGDSLSENLTVHRLLGAELSNHPAASIIEFNPVAPTIMSKALRLVLKKNALLSKQRSHTPSSKLLKRVSEMGDIRNAISALEFMCVRDGAHEGSRAVTAKSRLKRPGKLGTSTSKTTERENMEFVMQREASLGIFHAVGKVVYNKRDPITASSPATEQSPHAPQIQSKHNSLVSQVSVENLIDETGTDISTFIAALHENYPLSCAGSDFIESFESCAELVSDADILGPGNLFNSRLDRSAGIARTTSRGSGTSVDILRQDELSFQVAVRGLIFSLPYPVNRQGVDPYKMFYPTSSRLWRQTEEIGALIDIWVRRLTNPDTGPSSVSIISPEMHNDNLLSPRCMLSRDEVTLERLPYMRMISKVSPEIEEIDKITRFQGNIQRSQDAGSSDMDGSLFESDATQPPVYPILTVRRNLKQQWRQKASSENTSTQLAEMDVEKLTLSDDDIEDD